MILWFLAFYFTFITGLFVGMLMGYFARGKVKETGSAEVITHNDTQDVPANQIQRAVAASMLTAVPPVEPDEDAEIIERPDASRLQEINEDPSIRENKAAMSETLMNIPAVRELMEARNKFMKGVKHES